METRRRLGEMEEEPLRISAISFDGDMTLWDFQKVMRHSLKHALAELRRKVPAEPASRLTVDEMIDIRDEVADELRGKVWNLSEIRRIAFERTLERVGCHDGSLARHLNQVYRKHRFEDIELYPDVLPALDVLSPQFKIGLLSNGNSYPERCGLDGRFAFVVFSQDVRIEKPDRRIFEITAQRAGCQLEHFLHVGDSLENDVAGARNAGAPAVWLNRDGVRNDSGIQADFEITSLAELPPLLGVGRD